MSNKEFKQLEEQNDIIREQIRTHLNKEFMPKEIDNIFILINSLIENEIEQEGFCGE